MHVGGYNIDESVDLTYPACSGAVALLSCAFTSIDCSDSVGVSVVCVCVCVCVYE